MSKFLRANRGIIAAVGLLTIGGGAVAWLSADQATEARAVSAQALDSARAGLVIGRGNTASIQRLEGTMRAEFDRTNCIATLTDATKQRIADNPAVLDRECPPVRR